MRPRIVTLAALCLMLLGAAGQALAREKPEKPKKTQAVVGTVAVTKAKEGDAEVVKSITITATRKGETTAYSVVLDDNGKKVAEFDGKKVKATGTVEEKDGTKWLTVATCELAPAKVPKK